MNLRFLCAQPAIKYYSWQLEIMLNNFIEMGINLNQVDIVCWKENGTIPEEYSRLANGYPARFFFYDDTRETKHYISSIRPNILKEHFTKYPKLESEAIFYHDCDIVFTKPINWEQFLQDNKWYGSDCRWYISHDYIISKGQDILDKMCEIVDIDKQLVKDNELNSIGAQYLMKGINAQFWANVEKDCERLFKEITDINNEKKKTNPSYHELQIWCSDMWSVLWNGWKLGYESICHADLDFAWATSNEEEWNKLNIFHNAGVTDANGGLFYKAIYMNELPYNKDLKITDGTASKKYYDIIQRVEKKSVLL
jgi:hypothetical protein